MQDTDDKFSIVFSILKFYHHTTLSTKSFYHQNYATMFYRKDCFNVFGAVIKRPLRLVFDLQHIYCTCLYVLFYQCRSCDSILGYCFFQILSYSSAYVRINYEKTKGQNFPGTFIAKTKYTRKQGLLHSGIGRSQPKLNARESKTRHEHLAERNQILDTLGQVPRALCFLSLVVFVP